jgi:hypothetical protein
MKRKDPTESSENPLVQGLSSLKTTLNKNETTNEESIDSIMKSKSLS